MRTPHVLLAASLVAGLAGVAAAQTTAGYDPAQLPATKGTVAEYSLTPRGDVDGLILTDGTEIHLPPHLGTELVYAVKPGDAVTVHGLRARAVPMVQAMSVSNDRTGNTVTDNGPGGPSGPGRGPEQRLTAQGRIKSQLHGPQGELNGVLLEDGTIVRMPPPDAEAMASRLAPGASLYVRGEGFQGPLGRVIAAQSIGPSATQLAQIATPFPPGPLNRPPPPPPPGGPGFAPPPRPLGGP